MIHKHQVADYNGASSLYPRQEEADGAVEAVKDVTADIEDVIVEGEALYASITAPLTTCTSSFRRPARRS